MANIVLRISGVFAAIATAASLPLAARAQTDPNAFPTKAVRLVVGFTPGSATDVTARIFAQKFTEAWGVSTVVENVPGVGGAVGLARVAKSPPDGYTINYSGNGALTIIPTLQAKPMYDVVRDFTPISMVLSMPSILAVNNEVPAKTVQELITYARNTPGKLSYASPGAGTPQHIAIELLKTLAKIDIVHVPYKGANFTDVIGGRVPVTLQNAGAILPAVRDGKLRGLAVTSLKRSANMPEFPTIAESGYPGFEAISWFGLLAPAGTPAPIVRRVHDESMKVINAPELRTRFSQLGLDISGKTGEEVSAIIKADIPKWAKVIKEAGITMAD